MAKFPNFIGGSHATQSVAFDAEETINLYVEQAKSPGAENPAALYSTPGFTPWAMPASVADVGARATCVAGTRFFMLFGAGLYEFDANGTPTKRGAVALDQNPGQIIFNGVIGGQLGIATGGNVYSYDLATNAAPVLRLAGGYTHLAYAGGFGLALNPTTGKVNVSNAEDLTTWDVGTFFQRALFADPWQAMFVDANNLVWLIGTETFDVRYNTGGTADQPFENLSGLVGAYGIAGKFAYGQSARGNFWLAKNREGVGPFVVTTGSVPQPVSTYAIDSAIASYLRTSTVDDAEVLLYHQEGHTFANISFPSARATLSYDIEGQSWAKRGRWDPNHGYDVWSPRVHAIAFGKHLIGDRTTGTIYQMDTTIGTEIDGSGIRRLRRAPCLISERKRIPIDQFELHMDVGLGVAGGQGAAPVVMLRQSVDNGRTWGNERQASVGRMGEYGKRVYWRQLGAPDQVIFEVSFTEPIPYRIVDAFINNAEAA